jgi:hypothetical protein
MQEDNPLPHPPPTHVLHTPPPSNTRAGVSSSYCYICVLVLPCMCPHAAIYVSSSHAPATSNTRACVSSYCYLYVYVSMRQHTSAYVSIRQHTSAYVSIRQHTSAYQHTRMHVVILLYICVLTLLYVSASASIPPRHLTHTLTPTFFNVRDSSL